MEKLIWGTVHTSWTNEIWNSQTKFHYPHLSMKIHMNVNTIWHDIHIIVLYFIVVYCTLIVAYCVLRTYYWHIALQAEALPKPWTRHKQTNKQTRNINTPAAQEVHLRHLQQTAPLQFCCRVRNVELLNSAEGTLNCAPSLAFRMWVGSTVQNPCPHP